MQSSSPRPVVSLFHQFEVEVLDGGRPPRVLHKFSHAAFSLHNAIAKLHMLKFLPSWPKETKGFRILDADRKELYIWLEGNSSTNRATSQPK